LGGVLLFDLGEKKEKNSRPDMKRRERNNERLLLAKLVALEKKKKEKRGSPLAKRGRGKGAMLQRKGGRSAISKKGKKEEKEKISPTIKGKKKCERGERFCWAQEMPIFQMRRRADKEGDPPTKRKEKRGRKKKGNLFLCQKKEGLNSSISGGKKKTKTVHVKGREPHCYLFGKGGEKQPRLVGALEKKKWTHGRRKEEKKGELPFCSQKRAS